MSRQEIIPVEALRGHALRRPVDAILGVRGGASPFGATYYKRLLACPREHYLHNQLGWRARGGASDPLDTGLVFHLALEAYYRTLQARQHGAAGPTPEAAAWLALAPFQNEEGYAEIYATVDRMLGAYLDFYRYDEWEIVAVEETLEVDPEETGFPYSARLDLFIVDHTVPGSGLRVVEHKSVYRLDQTVIDGYAQDMQVLGHCWLVQREIDLGAYPPFIGEIVNLATKHKVPQLLRIPVTPSRAQLASFETTMRTWSKLTAVYDLLDWPQNFASCVRRFGRCEFFDYCRFNHDGSAPLRRDVPPEGFTNGDDDADDDAPPR